MSGYDSDEDEDLKRAIALSLSDAQQPEPQEPVDLTADDEVEEHEMNEQSNAVANMSQKDEIHGSTSMDAKLGGATTQSDYKRDPSTKVEAPRSGLFALDRKKMEEERLARILKRKASASPPPSRSSDSRMSKAPKMSSNPADATRFSGTHVKSAQEASPRPDVMSYTQQQTALRATGVQYPKGVVKKTWAYGYPRENDIKIEVCGPPGALLNNRGFRQMQFERN